MPRTYWVYILASRTRRLYIGVTGSIHRRLAQHRDRLGGSDFAGRYRMERLVHAEPFGRPEDAIRREKQLKGWVRVKKLALISKSNPTWEELVPFEGGRGREEQREKQVLRFAQDDKRAQVDN